MDPNTSQTKMEIIAADPSVRAFSREYLRIPDWILNDSQIDCRHRYLYAVLVKYSDISAKNSNLPNPGRETLASECGFSVEAISDWMKILRDRGWVSWQRRPNKTNLWYIHGPESVDNNGNANLPQPNSGNAKLADEHSSLVPPPKGGDPNSSTESVKKNDEESRSRRGSLDNNAPQNQQPMAQKNLGATETPARNGVSNEVKTWREAENPWWTINKRQERFNFLYDNYPKMSPRIEAMVSYRLALTQEEVDDNDFLNRVWHGLQWWKEKWQKEGTEERFIPAMGRWFERRQWEQANVDPAPMG